VGKETQRQDKRRNGETPGKQWRSSLATGHNHISYQSGCDNHDEGDVFGDSVDDSMLCLYQSRHIVCVYFVVQTTRHNATYSKDFHSNGETKIITHEL